MSKFLNFSSCIILALSIYAGGVTAEAQSVSGETEAVQVEACVEESEQVESSCIEDVIVENFIEEQSSNVENCLENCEAQEFENAEEMQALELSHCGFRCEQDEVVYFCEEGEDWHVDGELENQASVEMEGQDTIVDSEYQVISGVTEVVFASGDAENKGEVVAASTAYAIPANEAPATENNGQSDIEDSRKQGFEIEYPSVAAPESTTVPVEDEITIEIEDEQVPNSGVETGEDLSEQEEDDVEKPIEVEAVVIEDEREIQVDSDFIPNSSVSKEVAKNDVVNEDTSATEVLPQTGVLSTQVFQGLGLFGICIGLYIIIGLKRQRR
ncbi:MAG: hypothetical protein II992_03980 [Lachnospiraceae bacterium]|nr:hypothetical protein [Lachnospiraceae bacterium]